MRILITNKVLNQRTGTETAVRDIAIGLIRGGHEVMVYSPVLGDIAHEVANAGATVADDLRQFTKKPDVIHGHHNLETVHALAHFPDAPGIFVMHDIKAWHDVPPVTPQIKRYVAVSIFARERLERYGIPADFIRIIFNSFDPACFPLRQQLREKPVKALLFFSNAPAYGFIEPVQTACAELDIALDLIGEGFGNLQSNPGAVLPEYDLVFGTGRCAIEAAATGAAVILYGSAGLGPLITTENIAFLQERNFGRLLLHAPHETGAIIEQIRKYDVTDALAVSRYVRENASLEKAISQYLTVYQEALGEPLEAKTDPLTSALQNAVESAAKFESLSLEESPMPPLSPEISTQIGFKLVECPGRVSGIFTAVVELENRSDQALASHGAHPVYFSYHWYAEKGECVVFEGRRTEIVRTIFSGEKRMCRVVIEPPATHEKCRLCITLVQEKIAWLDELNPPVAVEAVVEHITEEHKSLIEESQRLKESFDLATEERDNAQKTAEMLQVERDRALQTVGQIETERDSLRHTADQLRADRDAVQKALEVLRAECDVALQTAGQLKAEWDSLRQIAGQLEAERNEVRALVEQLEAERNIPINDAWRFEAERNAAYAEAEQLRTKMNQYEETLRQVQAERGAWAAFTHQLNELCRRHLNKQSRSDSSKKTRIYYQGIFDGATAAYQKHFGKKRLKLNDPEPRYNFIKRTFRSLFRKQGSVNKGFIASFRNQIAWNKTVTSRLETMEAFCLELSQTLSAFSRGQTEPQRTTEGANSRPDDAASSDRKNPEELSRLNASAKAVYKSLERASAPH